METTTPQNVTPLPEVRDALVLLILSAHCLLQALIAGDPEHTSEYKAACRGLAEVDLNMGPFEE